MVNIYLGSRGIFGSIVIPTHTQNVFCAVIELREAIELAVAVVYCRLVHAVEGAMSVVGAVQEGLENLSALVKVSRASQIQLLRRCPNLIFQVSGKTRIRQRRLCCLTKMLT